MSEIKKSKAQKWLFHSKLLIIFNLVFPFETHFAPGSSTPKGNFFPVIDTYNWKYKTSNLYLMLGFWHKCTERLKPNVEIKMMSPYHSVQMSTQYRLWLRCMCWKQTVPNRYIEVEFNFGYFQWYVPMIKTIGCRRN